MHLQVTHFDPLRSVTLMTLNTLQMDIYIVTKKGRDDQHAQSSNGRGVVNYDALTNPAIFVHRIEEVKTNPSFYESARVYVDRHIKVYNTFPYSVKTQSDEVKFLISLKMMATLV